MTNIFAIISGILLFAPCVLHCIISFIEKNKRTSYYWKKKTLIFTYLTCFALAVVFIALAVVY